MTLAAAHETVRFVAPKVGTGTVLLIEDDVPLAGVLIRLMNAEGYQVVHVGSGGAAVEKVMNRAFDVVISDVHDKAGGGVDVLDVVRAYDPDVPLVLMTCSAAASKEAASLGVFEHLSKPASREAIVSVLGRATKVRRMAMERREVREKERHAIGTAVTLRPDWEASERKLTTPIGAAPPSLSDALEMVTSRVMRSRAQTVPAAPASTSGKVTVIPSSSIDTLDEPPLSMGPPTLPKPFAATKPAAKAPSMRPAPRKCRSERPVASTRLVSPPSEPSATSNAGSSGTGAVASETCPSAKALFERALASLSVELEPIADAKSKKLLGFATRMFSGEESLGTETTLVACAEQLGRLEQLRRRVRDLAVRAFADAPSDALLFVDVHPSDLLDGDLYSPEPALARIADRVILQVRTQGLSIEDLSARASVLRFVGFRLAIADLDAGHARLEQIADLSPEFVKIDARLVRGVNTSSGRRRLVSALVSMCAKLDAVSVAEGVSTAEENEALIEAGCGFVQGSLVVRHSAAVSSRRGSARTASAR